MIGITSAIIQDVRVKRKDGTYAVKLRITYNREQRYYPLGVCLTADDWERTQAKNPRKHYKAHQLYFNKIEQRAIEVIKEIHPFSFQVFEKKFNQKADRSKDYFFWHDNYVRKLEKEERWGTAENHAITCRAIRRFVTAKGRKHLHFADITPEWLTEVERWMLDKGTSPTTVGIYLRNVRTVVNVAIGDGLMPKDLYPFGKRKYQVLASRNIKKALTLREIKMIFDYQPLTTEEAQARDLYLFSYLCNGANVRDIVFLKYKNISEGKIRFIRSKTERTTRRNLKPITAMLLPETEKIINKWGVKAMDPEQFVFGLIDTGDDSRVAHNKAKQATKTINKYMKRIGKKLNLANRLTTYSARHSFATVMKRSGASMEFISESLGHSSFQTTEYYLDSFDDELKASFQKHLVNFDSLSDD